MSKLEKFALVFIVTCFAFVSTSFAQTTNPFELRLEGQFIKPSDSFYDNSPGGDIQTLLWLNKMFGIGLGVGYTSWDGEGADAVLNSWGGGTAVGVKGSVSQLPITLFGEVCAPINDRLSFNFSAGLGYDLVNSDFDVAAAQINSHGDIVQLATGKLNIDDAFIGRLSASGHIAITQNTNLIVGLGYQDTLSGGDLSVGDYEFDKKADLGNIYGFSGLGFKF